MTSLSDGLRKPSSILDKKQAETHIALLSHQLSLKGNLVSGRLLECFFTPPAPVPMLCVGPRWTLHGETRSGWGIPVPEAPSQGPSSHEDHTMEQLFLCLC